MCGIAGIIWRQGHSPVNEGLASACIRALRHRGPDGSGMWSDNSCYFLHTRLAILDINAGQQPMTNEDHSIVVTFNGEIYNSPALRIYLQHKGHIFATRTDTEVLVHLYEEFGPDMLAHLRGMFAFAIWDARRRTLLLARDRFGIKPLYYAFDNKTFLFASQPSAILATALIPRRLNLDSLPGLLYYGCQLPWRCVYEYIYKCPPGHYLYIDANTWQLTLRSYWRLPSQRLFLNYSTVLNDIPERIREVVQAHLLADVPLGIALSGGLDSSIIAHHAAMSYKTRLSAFTINWSSLDQGDKEFYRAKLTGQCLGLDHHELSADFNPQQLLSSLITTLDEPLGDTSVLPLYALCNYARARIKVLFTGDGGDEIFAGYRRYRTSHFEATLGRYLSWLCQASLHLGYEKRVDKSPSKLLRKVARLADRLRLETGLAYAVSLAQAPPGLIESWLHPELQRVLDEDRQRLASLWHACPVDHFLQRMAYVDICFLLPEAFLVKADRASMAVGLEIRPPLLDHTLVEWVWSLPPQYKLHGYKTKALLREAYKDLLPSQILHATKQGFEQRSLREQVSNLLPELFDHLYSYEKWKKVFVIPAIHEAAEGLKRNYHEYAQPLWNLYCFVRWHDYWLRN